MFDFAQGTTTAFSVKEARKILEAPDVRTVIGLWDRAILSVGLQDGPRRSEIGSLLVKDYHTNAGYESLHFIRKGGEDLSLAVNPQTAQRIDDYLVSAGHAGCNARSSRAPHSDATANAAAPANDPALEQLIDHLPRATRPAVPAAPAPQTQYENHGGTLTRAVTTWNQIHAEFDSFLAFDSAANVLWPGSVVVGDFVQRDGIARPVLLPRAPGTITVTNLSFHDPNAQSQRLVASPNLHNTQNGLQEILGQPATTAAQIEFKKYQFHTIEEAYTDVGLSGSYLSASADSSLRSQSSSDNSNFVVKLQQVYYTATFERPNKAEAFFDNTVTVADASQQFGGLSPAYVSSVTYGRILILFISSHTNAVQLDAALNASFNGLVSSGQVQLTTEQKSLLQESNIEVMALGGPSSAGVEILGGDQKGEALANYLNWGKEFQLTSPGVPIAYQIRYLNNDEPEKLALATQYPSTSYSPALLTSVEVIIHTETDDKDDSEGASITIHRGDQILASGGPYGHGQTWGDQDDNNNHQPHVFHFNLNPPIPYTDAGSTVVTIDKEQDGGNGGKGWGMSLEVTGQVEGTQQPYFFLQRTGIVKLGNGNRNSNPNLIRNKHIFDAPLKVPSV